MALSEGLHNGLLVPPRSYDAEILDRIDQKPEDLEAAFAAIRGVNRFLGGISGVLGPLRSMARAEGWREFSLLDVGTGTADIPVAVHREAKARGWRVRCAGVEIHPVIARMAARDGGPTGILRGDARRLPLADRSFDVVAASMFLHHFDEDEATLLLSEFYRVARHAVIVNDLSRNRIPWLAIRVLGFVFRANPMFRHDAPLSVLRGFTRGELREIARRAAVTEDVTIRRKMPWRLVLVARKTGRTPTAGGTP